MIYYEESKNQIILEEKNICFVMKIFSVSVHFFIVLFNQRELISFLFNFRNKLRRNFRLNVLSAGWIYCETYVTCRGDNKSLHPLIFLQLYHCVFGVCLQQNIFLKVILHVKLSSVGLVYTAYRLNWITIQIN